MIDFSAVDAFKMVLEVGSILVLVNLNDAGGTRALRGQIDSNRFLPVMSRFRIVFAAFEALPLVLDFRSIVSFLSWDRWRPFCG